MKGCFYFFKVKHKIQEKKRKIRKNKKNHIGQTTSIWNTCRTWMEGKPRKI